MPLSNGHGRIRVLADDGVAIEQIDYVAQFPEFAPEVADTPAVLAIEIGLLYRVVGAAMTTLAQRPGEVDAEHDEALRSAMAIIKTTLPKVVRFAQSTMDRMQTLQVDGRRSA